LWDNDAVPSQPPLSYYAPIHAVAELRPEGIRLRAAQIGHPAYLTAADVKVGHVQAEGFLGTSSRVVQESPQGPLVQRNVLP
jgi:hypothetical protein